MLMSEMMLNKQVIKALIPLLRHRGSVMSGFQNASRGVQAKMVRNVLIV